MHPGEFYALPQSPQIFKQILMISGFDRYFQIARCFRDEDQRADRQLEFTQVDLEMSFPRHESVFAVVEQFLVAAFAAAGIALPTPFPRITYDDSMRQFGSTSRTCACPASPMCALLSPTKRLATLQIDPALPVVALRIPAWASSAARSAKRTIRSSTRRRAQSSSTISSGWPRAFPSAASKVRELTGAAESDFVIVVAGDPAHHIKASDTKFPGRLSEREINVYSAAGNFRSELAKKYADRHKAFDITEAGSPKGSADCAERRHAA